MVLRQAKSVANAVAFLLAVSLGACGGGEAGGDVGGDVHGDGDADGDGDAEADADADADSDEVTDAEADADADADSDACLPDCAARECGPDPVCGEECGPGCGADEPCNADGRCVGTVPGTWVAITAGTFTMGSPVDEVDREPGASRETQHEVTLTVDFEILATEVATPDFEALMGYSPSYCGEFKPVEQLNWYEAAAYFNALSDIAGLSRCYDCTGSGTTVTCSPAAAFASPYECPGYRFPTEAEWEYAARAGTTTATYNGDYEDAFGCAAVVDPIACYNAYFTCGCGVGSLAPNAWGLYDMLGGVAEYCHDWLQEDLGSEAVSDPWGPESGEFRVVRGGSWEESCTAMRAAQRTAYAPGFGYRRVGMRPVRSLP